MGLWLVTNFGLLILLSDSTPVILVFLENVLLFEDVAAFIRRDDAVALRARIRVVCVGV